MIDVTWRPTAASFRNLAVFWATVAVAASASAGVRGDGRDRSILSVLLVASVVGGLLVAWGWSRPRFDRALQAATRPRLRNWPPDGKQQAESARSAGHDARRGAVIGLLLGAGAGLVPLVGPAVAASGVAGCAGTLLVLASVRRYEAAHDAVVLTASTGAGSPRRRDLVVGVAPRPH